MIGENIKKIISEQQLPNSYVRFYIVGIVLFMTPYTRSIFYYITPVTLLLVVGSVFYHHRGWSRSTIIIFAFIAISSFFLEVVGVDSGKLFGSYCYDVALGLKLWNTPLIIGLNWLFLVYASGAIVYGWTRNSFLRIVGGAGLMILYDIVLEMAAPSMRMWQFDREYPPIENFITWFVAALLYHALLVGFRVWVDNKSARSLFWIQLIFFGIITTFSLLFIR